MTLKCNTQRASTLRCLVWRRVGYNSIPITLLGTALLIFFHSGQCLGEGRKMYGILLIIWIDVVFKSLASFAISTHNCVQNALFEYTSLLWNLINAPCPRI